MSYDTVNQSLCQNKSIFSDQIQVGITDQMAKTLAYNYSGDDPNDSVSWAWKEVQETVNFITVFKITFIQQPLYLDPCSYFPVCLIVRNMYRVLLLVIAINDVFPYPYEKLPLMTFLLLELRE